MFVKGDKVRLKNGRYIYDVLVTSHRGMDDDCFSGVIIRSEWPTDAFNGELNFGTYAKDYQTEHFELLETV